MVPTERTAEKGNGPAIWEETAQSVRDTTAAPAPPRSLDSGTAVIVVIVVLVVLVVLLFGCLLFWQSLTQSLRSGLALLLPAFLAVAHREFEGHRVMKP